MVLRLTALVDPFKICNDGSLVCMARTDQETAENKPENLTVSLSS